MARVTNKKRFMQRVFIGLSIFVLALVSGVFMIKPKSAYADPYDDQIRILQAQNDAYAQQIAVLNAQSSSLANAVAELQAQAAVLQNEINISQAKFDKLTIQIKETELKIQQSKDALGQTLADIYIDDSITPVEMLASSKNISDYIDKQEYRNSIKNSLSLKIDEIKKLKASLEDDKAAVTKVLDQQKTQRDELARRQNEQANLLSETRGQESAYQSLIGANSEKIAQAKAAQALIRSRINSSGGGVQMVDSGLLGEYPWNSSNCWMSGFFSNGGADGNGGDGHGYGCRQCVSYVAWKIAKVKGVYYNSWGNAWDFSSRLINSAGYSEGEARPGSAAAMNPRSAGNGIYGHIAWVEAVSDDGSKVLVSQYNYNYGAGYGMYSKMWLGVKAFDRYVHIQ